MRLSKAATRAALLTVLLLLAPFCFAAPPQQRATFSGADWILQGDLKVERLEGREALHIRNGSARLMGAEFRNGTVEFDVRTSGHRSFVGVGFRAQGSHREDFYLRPHNSGRFDAMQYTPVDNGLSAWQLYPEYNASLEIPVDRWLHVKLIRRSRLCWQEYIGQYRSPELEWAFRLVADGGRLVAEDGRLRVSLSPVGHDFFRGDRGWFSSLRFLRASDGRVRGFRVSNDRTWNLLFSRQE